MYTRNKNTWKEKLVYLGREYPAGYHDFFRPKLKSAFLKNKDLKDKEEIEKKIQFGEYIIKGDPYWLLIK